MLVPYNTKTNRCEYHSDSCVLLLYVHMYLYGTYHIDILDNRYTIGYQWHYSVMVDSILRSRKMGSHSLTYHHMLHIYYTKSVILVILGPCGSTTARQRRQQTAQASRQTYG